MQFYLCLFNTRFIGKLNVVGTQCHFYVENIKFKIILQQNHIDVGIPYHSYTVLKVNVNIYICITKGCHKWSMEY